MAGKSYRKGKCQKLRDEEFAFKLPLKQESLLSKIRDEKMFGYVESDLEVPDGL